MTEIDDHRIDRKAMVRGFDRAARGYDRAAVLQRTVAERLIDRLQELRLAPERILDIGSGTGFGARMLARRFRHAELLQLDLSPGMLRAARGRFGRLRWRHRFLCADAASLPLRDACAELAFSSLMLHWCADPERVLREMRRMLRPGGLLLLSACGPDTLAELRESWAAVDDQLHVHPFLEMHDVGDALLRVGFAEPVLETERIVLTYPDLSELSSSLRRLGAVNRGVGRSCAVADKAALRCIRREYERFRLPDGRLPATFEIVYAHGWRAASEPASPNTFAIPVDSIHGRRSPP